MLLLLLEACDPDPAKDSPSPAAEETGDAAGDTGDTGHADTGDTADSAAGDTAETGDTATDTGLCDPTPYGDPDTAWDTAGIVPFQVRVDTGEPEYVVTEPWGDCDTQPTDAYGHPRLACGDAVLDVGGYYVDSRGTMEPSADWVGDIDGDGFDDAVLTARDKATDGVDTFLFFGGESLASNGAVDPTEVADAWLIDDPDRRIVGSGDFDGDGLSDLIVGETDAYEHAVGLGIAFSVPGRSSGELSDWSVSGASSPTITRGAFGSWSGGTPRLVRAGDVTGDHLADVVLGLYETVVVHGGSPDLRGATGVGEADTWSLVHDELCGEFQSESCYPNIIGIPVGDIDGDGAPDLAVQAEPYWDISGVRYEVVSLSGLPPCVYSIGDVAYMALEEPEEHGSSMTEYGVVEGAFDLEGDGYDDLVVATVATESRSSPADGEVLWLVHGGSERLVSGDLRRVPDRIEFSRREYGVGWEPTLGQIQALDADGDGTTEILVGGTVTGDQTRGSRLDLYSGAARGIQDEEDALLNLVGEPSAYMNLTPANGRGDIDGDGREDLFAFQWYVDESYSDYTWFTYASGETLSAWAGR